MYTPKDDGGLHDNWTVDLKNNSGKVFQGVPLQGELVGAKFTMSTVTLSRLASGDLDPVSALMWSLVELEGSKKAAAKVPILFNEVTAKLGKSSKTLMQSSETFAADFLGEDHTRYFKQFLGMVPSFMESQDTNRLTLVFFALAGLDALGKLDAVVSSEAKSAYIDWIYAQQVLPDATEPEINAEKLGFRGGPFLGLRHNPSCCPCGSVPYDTGHLAMGYTALASLAILGDNFSRVRCKEMAHSLTGFQRLDGSFSSTPVVCQSGETDMRFVYCACCIGNLFYYY